MNIPFYYYWGDWVSKESREFMFDSVSMYACLEIELINMNSHGLCSCAFLSGLLFGTRVWRRKRGVMACSLLLVSEMFFFDGSIFEVCDE